MGVRFRKTIKIAPGVKININKKSVGMTVGTRGAHYTINSKGKKTASVGIPGTGLSYVDSCGGGTSKKNSSVNFEEAPQEFSVSEKSKNTALLLCIFLGVFGAHRFYAGKIGTGILWFLTCGLFAFGWIYDIFKIATGTFSDGNNAIILH